MTENPFPVVLISIAIFLIGFGMGAMDWRIMTPAAPLALLGSYLSWLHAEKQAVTSIAQMVQDDIMRRLREEGRI